MSIATIGTRLDELQTMVAQMTAPAAAPAGRALDLVLRRRARRRPELRRPPRPSRAPAAGTAFDAEINAAAASNGIDPALLKGLVSQESGLQPERPQRRRRASA